MKASSYCVGVGGCGCVWVCVGGWVWVGLCVCVCSTKIPVLDYVKWFRPNSLNHESENRKALTQQLTIA